MSKTHNKKGYFALWAGRAILARLYLWRYVYVESFFKTVFESLFLLVIFSHAVQATSIVCNEPSSEELDLPEELVNWNLESDEILGTHYAFDLKSNIDEVELDNIFILKRNGEKIDFFMNLSFSELKGHSKIKYPYASAGFSLSNEIRDGSELYAVFNRSYLNCLIETRKYRIRMPHNKKRNEMDGSVEPPIR